MIIKHWYSAEIANLCKDIEPFDVFDLYNDIDSHEDNGMTIVTTSGIESHTDPLFTRYSVFCIISNVGLIAKGYEQPIEDFPIQLPGTIITLDIHAPHECIEDPRIKLEENEYPSWGAALIEYDTLESIPSDKELEEIFVEWLQND